MIPPASTGTMSTGRNASRPQRAATPMEPNFPSKTSSTLTRVRNNSPRVPSRHSALMASAVKRHAPQLTRNAAPTIPLKTKVPIIDGVPNRLDSMDCKQINTPARATQKRVQ